MTKRALFILAVVAVGFFVGGTRQASAATCAGSTPGNVTVTSSGASAYYIVYGVTGAGYVFVQSRPNGNNYMATHLSGGDWGVSVSVNGGNGTYEVAFYPSGDYCTSSTLTVNAPPPTQYYSCYGGGSCHPDDNSGTFPNDPSCGGNPTCYVPPAVQYYSCYGGGSCHPDDNSGTFPNDPSCGGNPSCYVPPPVQYYSCYGGGSCHPDDNSGTFPNDPSCGGNPTCYVPPAVQYYSCYGGGSCHPDDNSGTFPNDPSCGGNPSCYVPPPVQYYSCYGGGSCHPDDNSGTFPNDNTCGGNPTCYVAPPPGTVSITSNNQSAAHYTTFPNGTTLGWNGDHQWTSAALGSYSLVADGVAGYDKSITPPSPQTLGAGGTINWTITYTVIPAVSATLTCPSSPISYNSSATVTWSSSNATSCTGAPSGGTGTSGQFSTGNLTSSQTYSVTCVR